MQQNKSAFLGNDNLFPLLLKMSIPATIGMVTAALYNVVDTIFVGRGVGPLGIAGLSVAFPVQMIMQAFAQMIGIGSASIISRRLGEKRYDEAASTLGTGFIAIILITGVLVCCIALFPEALLKVFGATDTIMPYSLEYLKTVVWGFPLIAFSIAGNNMIRAEGRPKTAMGTMLIGMGLNIILDPIFIFTLHMGIRGAALATVISQGCSFAWIFLFYLTKKSSIPLERGHITIKPSLLREMVILGTPNAVQTAGMSILTMIINNTLGTLGGDMAISTYGMVQRLLSFVFMPILGISQGFQPIAGYNYGARRFDRVKKVLLLAILTAAAVSLVFYGLIRFFPESFIAMFTTDAELIRVSADTLLLMSLVMPLISLQIVPSIYFQAIGKGTAAVLLGLSRQFLILIPLVLILPRIFGLNGVWASFPVSDVLSMIVTVVALTFELRHLNERHRLETAGQTV